MPDNNPNIERENRILDAAARLITHYGFDKTTVSDIAEAAGISKGAVYLHYKSKEALFEALIIRESETILEDMLTSIERDPNAGSIFGLYQHAILAVMRSPLIHAVVTRDQRVVGEMARKLKDTGIGAQGNLIRYEMVAQLQAANVIRQDLDAVEVSYILALIRYGFLTIGQVIPEDQRPPIDRVGQTLGEILERGLAPPDGGDREKGKAALENILQRLRVLIQQYKEQGT
ncbi:MAG: TetR/AcrR family transcriptional regulator [Anaerolineae bacterium]|nr:TetR/AcrR family transcriptional regulator [Anaerolineae bacterium]